MNLTVVKKHYSDLTKEELAGLLLFRSQIFNVELGMPLQTPDEYDFISTHILLTDVENNIVGYVRCIPSLNDTTDNTSFSNLCLKPEIRKTNSKSEISFGILLANEAIKTCKEIKPNSGIIIHTTLQLQRWYQKLGFTSVGEPKVIAQNLFIWMTLNPRAEHNIESYSEPKMANRVNKVELEQQDLEERDIEQVAEQELSL